ncbi:MAG: MjaI family restriction endonuclease [Candidatus Electryonea clarkiae]|nr:MjaI family restriction endonuclease [Candidatus Electryonea clarkiae]MDP8287548.1 MjaI family restriction endonuclease [Candidatus Electryonea clarkiae]
MDKEWIKGNEGRNLKFKRETLLNYGMNRWGLNKAHSVGSTSELIRACTPSSFEDWEGFYFKNARQKKKDGINITKEYITGLGQTLYIKLSEVIQNELESIQEEECIDYAYNLILNRTYEGYRAEIDTIYGQLEGILKIKIDPAPDKWDRTYNVDFCIEVKDRFIGIQIKPISTGIPLDHYQWEEMHRKNHERFFHDQGGKVFFVFSVKSTGKKKIIHNVEVIDEIQKEIDRLSK